MRAVGFGPVFQEDSRLLILGSFPSVKSREEGFYYGNPRNRFWKTLFDFFEEPYLETIEKKRAFLLKNQIALWDVVESCEISGSSDQSIKEEIISDLSFLFDRCKIEKIFCNGRKSFSLLKKHFPALLNKSVLLPSTSPANVPFSEEIWERELSKVFPNQKRLTNPVK